MKTYVLNQVASVAVRGGKPRVCREPNNCQPLEIELPESLQMDRQWWNDAHLCTVKILEVLPGERLSDQRHAHRTEHWVILTTGVIVELESPIGERSRLTPIVGDRVTVPQGSWHRLSCDRDQLGSCRVLEISSGEFSEDDIERRSDDYGRS